MSARDVNLPEHLDLIAAAPEGIRKLRGLILELAVRGKLVPQDPKDEPASELLKRIAQERARLEAEGTCKKSKATSVVGEEEERFALPDGWKWVRLGILLSKIGAGSTPLGGKQVYVNEGIRFLRSQNVWNEGLRLDDVALIPPETHQKMSGTHVQSGDLLFNITGASIGRCAIVPETFDTGNVSQHVTIIRSLSKDILRFLHAVLISDLVQKTVMDVQVGVSREGLSIGKLAQFVIPIPPLAEQDRIVAKVDELMALCDQLEAEQTDAASAHAKLVDTLLGTLTQSTDAAELAANWQRLAEHFNALFTTESSLDALKQTILQLAVMGKLVPQDPNDEPASELLKRIAQERTRLEAEGLCKKSKSVPPVGEKERPFEAPDGWAWVRWNEIAQKIGDINHKMPNTVKDGVPYVSPRDFYPGNSIDFDGAKKISRDDFLRLSAKIRPVVGDIIYPRYGTIGENRLVVDDLEFLASYSCCVIKTLNGFIAPTFQFYFSISRCCREQAKAAENKTTQANVGIKSIQEFAVPLPPLAEQHRIVAKVDELIVLCDRLKADLGESRTRQARLSATLIESALAAA